jgi:hypothetical protein
MVYMKNTSLKRLTGHEISKLLFQPSELKKIEIRYLNDIELSKKQNPPFPWYLKYNKLAISTSSV